MKRWSSFPMTPDCWGLVPNENGEVTRKWRKVKTYRWERVFPKVIFRNSRSNVLFKCRSLTLKRTGGNAVTAFWRLEERTTGNDDSDAMGSTKVISVWLGRRPKLLSMLSSLSSVFFFSGESENAPEERHAEEKDKLADWRRFGVGCNVAWVECRA